MSKVSRLCEFSPSTRKRIKERDGGCIFCQVFGYSGFPATQIMHYYPRSQLGLGLEQNGAFGCVIHHQELDNGKQGKIYKRIFREYLESLYDGWAEMPLIFSKWEEWKNGDGEDLLDKAEPPTN